MRKAIYILIIAFIICAFSFVGLRSADMLRYIPGTDADGKPNYAVSVGGDDCYFTAQTGDMAGLIFYCTTIKEKNLLMPPVPQKMSFGEEG